MKQLNSSKNVTFASKLYTQIPNKNIFSTATAHCCAKSKTFSNISTFLMICAKDKNTITVCLWHFQQKHEETNLIILNTQLK